MSASPQLNQIETIKEIAVGELTSDYLARYKDQPNEVFMFKKLLASRFKDERAFVSRYTDFSLQLQVVRHKNVISFFEVFEEDALCFVTAEYVSGRSFRLVAQRAAAAGAMPVGVARSVAAGCMAALKHMSNLDAQLISGGFFAGDIILGFDGKVRLKGFGIGSSLDVANEGLRNQIRAQKVSDWEQMLKATNGEALDGIGAVVLLMAPETFEAAGVEVSGEMGAVLGVPQSVLRSLRTSADLAAALGDMNPPEGAEDNGETAAFMAELFGDEIEAEQTFLAENGFLIRQSDAGAPATEAVGTGDGTVMLEAETANRTFFAEDNEVEEATTVITSQVDPDLGIPQRLGPLEIQKKLGEGGMGAVYRAIDPNLEVIRAIKVLSPERATDVRFLARFKREARVAANVQHENIPTIYSVGEDQGFHYIIMEYIEGSDLKDHLGEAKKLPIPIALLIVSEVCRALDFAHDHHFVYRGEEVRGIIHRDIKPENIMLTHEGGIKLMDFGIARPTEVTGETVAGTVMGTFAYMSLEQLEGQSTIDGRADIFSLGVVLYELVTGQRPFPGQTMTTVITNIMKGEFKPPHELDPNLPSEIDKIVTKALQRDREQRYKSAAEMGRDVNAILNLYEIDSPRRSLQSYLEDAVIPTTKSDAPEVHINAPDVSGTVVQEPRTGVPPAMAPGATKPEAKKGKGIFALVAVLAIALAGVAYYFTVGTDTKSAGVRVIVATNIGPAQLEWNGQEVVSEGDGQNFVLTDVSPGQYRVVATLLPKPDVKVDKMVVVKDTDTEIVNIEFPVETSQ